jgi:hypothetical protein
MPACFGAASRDPGHPCHNPELDHTVDPTPTQALLDPDYSCAQVSTDGALSLCWLGDPSAPPSRTVVLLGDSHARQWQAGLEVVAEAQGWRLLSITRSSCAFSAIPLPYLSGPEQTGCSSFDQAVIHWFAHHRDLATVFVAGLATGQAASASRDTLAQGDLAAWRALPSSVRHLIVIRDNPEARFDIAACVQSAIDAHDSAAATCSAQRQQALLEDPAVLAARELGAGRAQIADLTPFYCDAARCPAVIGGALVYRDFTHVTQVYDTTLGPYLLEIVRALMASRRR